jgi:KaiC/GvpD/RAD55 family RecA-like ATPase
VYSLRKFPGRAGNVGQALPDTFPSFGLARVAFRRGATSMIAGAPGSFKSVFALNLLVKWARAGMTALYFSADSDEFTVAKRVGGILTGEQVERVEYDMTRGNTSRYTDAMRDMGHAHFVYASLFMDGIANHVKAFEAVYGDWPDVVFVDNLMSYADSAGEWESMREMTRELDSLARETSAHIVILHHTSESAGFDKPAPRDRIQGKVTQVPRLVLTVAARGLALYWACVKNTNGPQDPGASVISEFLVRPSMQVEDISFLVEVRLWRVRRWRMFRRVLRACCVTVAGGRLRGLVRLVGIA